MEDSSYVKPKKMSRMDTIGKTVGIMPLNHHALTLSPIQSQKRSWTPQRQGKKDKGS